MPTKPETPTQKMAALGSVAVSDVAHAIRQHNASSEAVAVAVMEAMKPHFDQLYDRFDAIQRILTEQMHRFEKRLEQVDRDSKERDERLTNKVLSIDTRLVAVEGHVRDLQSRKKGK